MSDPIKRKPAGILSAKDIREKAQPFAHPWDPEGSQASGTFLGRALGLSRTGVNWIRLGPGKVSFVYHSHEVEEEWIYVLEGSGTADIDDREIAISAGDFMAFPTPAVAHQLRNTSDSDLVYLVGGEVRDVEVADFPRLGKRMLRRRERIDIYETSDARDFGPLQPPKK